MRKRNTHNNANEASTRGGVAAAKEHDGAPVVQQINGDGAGNGNNKEETRELTKSESLALVKYLTRSAENTTPEAVVEHTDVGARIDVYHPRKEAAWPLMMNAFGTANFHFASGIICRTARVASHGDEVDREGVNFMVATVAALKPTNEMESMLAAHIAALNAAGLSCADKIAHAHHPTHLQAAGNAYGKVCKALANSMELYRRFQTPKPAAAVQNASAKEGDQAIVEQNTKIVEEGLDKGSSEPLMITDQKAVPMAPVNDNKKEVAKHLVQRHAPCPRYRPKTL